jgi:hypothetical protein
MILDQTDRAPEATVAHDVIGDEPGAHGLDHIRVVAQHQCRLRAGRRRRGPTRRGNRSAFAGRLRLVQWLARGGWSVPWFEGESIRHLWRVSTNAHEGSAGS